MSKAPSIKDVKPAKKTDVKYDPHMKVMAPTIKKEETEEEKKDKKKEQMKQQTKDHDDKMSGRLASEETISELNRYEKETGTSSGSMNMPKGRPTQKGGDQSKAMRAVRQMMRSQTGKPEGQKKPADRRQQPTGLTPAQKVQRRREAAKKAQDTSHMSSRFD